MSAEGACQQAVNGGVRVSAEPNVITTLRQEVRNGTHFLYDRAGEVVCAASTIVQAYDLATQRAEAAEAERDEVMRCCRGTRMDDAALVSIREYVAEKLRIEADRDALRTDAARYRHLRSRNSARDYCLHCGYDGLALHTGALLDITVDQSIDAALAVQP